MIDAGAYLDHVIYVLGDRIDGLEHLDLGWVHIYAAQMVLLLNAEFAILVLPKSEDVALLAHS